MSEEKADVIVRLVNIIAEARAAQQAWEMVEDAPMAARNAESAGEAMSLLKETLMKVDTEKPNTLGEEKV